MDITTILDDVVRQFSDPLAFFRELVQNAIDAGTGEVDISLHYDDATGQAEIQVCDAGEGMSRAIIEGRLLRLFSSSKDDDLTKIGRFGIGFVSVFAIEPDLVVVETGRSGEYWRILFDADRSYELYALDFPVEGTTITILKSMPPESFASFAARARLVASSWCHHASVPVYWMGEDLRQPFTIDSPVTVSRSEEGTRIVMGITDALRGEADYYNRGLTLKANAESPWPYMSFKIDSRYLEHTLTRDQLIQDEHFQRAMVLLEELATQILPEELLRQLEISAQEIVKEPQATPLYENLLGHLAHLLQAGHPLPSGWLRRPIVATPEGPLSLEDLRPPRRGSSREHRELYCLRQPGPLQTLKPGARFIIGCRQRSLDTILQEVLEQPEQLPEQLDDRWLLPNTLDDQAPGLSAMTATLLSTTRPTSLRVLLTDLAHLSAVTDRTLGVIVPDTDQPVDLHQVARAPNLEDLKDHTLLLIDATRPEILRVLSLASKEPALAAMALLRLLFPPHNVAIADELDQISLTALKELQALPA